MESKLSDYEKETDQIKQEYPGMDPVHVRISRKQEIDPKEADAELEAFYNLYGAYAGYNKELNLPDGGPSYWCGGLGCISDANLSYVIKQMKKGHSFIKELNDGS